VYFHSFALFSLLKLIATDIDEVGIALYAEAICGIAVEDAVCRGADATGGAGLRRTEVVDEVLGVEVAEGIGILADAIDEATLVAWADGRSGQAVGKAEVENWVGVVFDRTPDNLVAGIAGDEAVGDIECVEGYILQVAVVYIGAGIGEIECLASL